VSTKEEPIELSGRAGDARAYCEDRLSTYDTGNTNIENTAICEVQSVMRFLEAENVLPKEKYRHFVEECCDGALK
jgi:hypothetical protein